MKNVQKNVSNGKQTRMVEMQEFEQYLTNATDFMEVLCKEAQGPLSLQPEMCSLNMGSMNFGLYPMLNRYKEFKHGFLSM